MNGVTEKKIVIAAEGVKTEPPYSPEFNAVERIWNYTRQMATHNRYFDTPEELCSSLFEAFGDIQQHPEKIMGRLAPFS